LAWRPTWIARYPQLLFGGSFGALSLESSSFMSSLAGPRVKNQTHERFILPRRGFGSSFSSFGLGRSGEPSVPPFVSLLFSSELAKFLN
jgi:hypothetical protein